MTGEGTFQVPTNYPDPHRQNVNSLPFGFAYGEGNDLMDLGHPTPPTGLHTLSVTDTTIALDWDDKADSNGSYNIYNGTTKLGTTRNGQANLGSLTASTAYNLTVTWVDEEGNESAKSPVLVVTTTDTTPPGPVTGLTVTGTTTTSVSLSWTNPSDSDFASVMIRRATGATPPASPTAGTLVTDASNTTTSFTDTGLTASTQYAYALFAHDSIPNYATAATTVTTTPGGGTGTPGN